MKKIYGNLTNRLEEGKNYTGRNLQIGDDITMYYYSDRTCYYITNIVSEKEIQVKKYYVCADHSKAGGLGHQNWLYFKTLKEHNQYLNQIFPEHNYNLDPTEDEPETWCFRYNKWMRKTAWNKNLLEKIINRCKEDLKPGVNYLNELIYRTGLTEEEINKIENNQTIYKYKELFGKISFGVKNYYYDWEF